MLAMVTMAFLKVQDVGRTKLNIINGIQINNRVHFMSKTTSPVPSYPVKVLISPAVNHLHTVATKPVLTLPYIQGCDPDQLPTANRTT